MSTPSTVSAIIESIIAQHGLVLGKTRSGKSSCLRLIVESLFNRHNAPPVCVIDPKGDWWGLRSGFPVVVFGGEHADVPLQPNAGALVADLFGREGHSCIVDMGGWTVADRIRFFNGFAQALFAQPRATRHLFIDEVHNFAPQGKVLDPESGKMLHWANRIASEGAGKGIVVWSASQRPQKVHKDFVTCAETLIAMRVIHPLDRAAVKDWMDGADSKRAASILTELANMPRGTGWVWSPEAKVGPVRVAFPKFRTFDSFAAPSESEIKRAWRPRPINLDVVRARMHDITEQAKSNDPAALRRRIAELEKRPAAQADPGLREAYQRLLREREQLKRNMDKLVRNIDSAIQTAQRGVAELQALSTGGISGVASGGSGKPVPGISTALHPAPPHQRTTHRPYSATVSIVSGSVPKGEHAILRACAEHPNGCTREQLTVLTGYKRSSRDAYIARLLGKGYVVLEGARVRITESGEQSLGEYTPLPRGSALLRHWLDRLPNGESKILSIVAEAYPNAISRDGIDAGFKRSSRDAYISRLAARELVKTSSGGVRASETLFD